MGEFRDLCCPEIGRLKGCETDNGWGDLSIVVVCALGWDVAVSGLGERRYGLEGEVLIVGEGGGLEAGMGELVMSRLAGVVVCRAGWEAARRVVRGELCECMGSGIVE